MALHRRLGKDSLLGLLSEDLLRRAILLSLTHVTFMAFFRNFQRVTCARFQDSSYPRPIGWDSCIRVVKPPTFAFLGRTFGVNTQSTSKASTLTRMAWEHFLINMVGGLFYDFVVLCESGFERNTDNLILMYESDPRRPVHGNDITYLQGLFDGFFAPYAPLMGWCEHAKPIVVRQCGDRVQTFVFGRNARSVPFLRSLTMRTPVRTRELVQARPEQRSNGWQRLRHATPFFRREARARVLFVDAAKGGTPLECLLE